MHVSFLPRAARKTTVNGKSKQEAVKRSKAESLKVKRNSTLQRQSFFKALRPCHLLGHLLFSYLGAALNSNTIQGEMEEVTQILTFQRARLSLQVDP